MKKKFEQKIKKTKSCWIWIGKKDRDGYGRFYVPGEKEIRAHRRAYILYIGKISKGLFVCHKCDNPSCVNPKHLWLGTHQQNLDDRKNKGRDMVGEKNGRAKLTWVKVKRIRKLYPKYSSVKLSKLFNVSKPTILDIIHNRHWKC